jgi:uncharacterized protein YciI
MQFLVIAYDGTDDGAPERRKRAREAHLKLGDELKASGNLLMAAAILDDQGNMIGSTLITEFKSRAELDAWLRREPYVTGEVWKNIDIRPCRVGPSFAKS